MMYVLSFQQSHTPRESIVVRTTVVTIGRSELCNVRLLENGVSDQHAAIEQRADGYFIRSIEATGTLQVNNEPVRDARLNSGDEIEIGSVRIRFEIVHDLEGKMQRSGLLTYAMIAVVVISIIGQVGMVAWIFLSPRPRTVTTDLHNTKSKERKTSNTASNQKQLSTPSVVTTPSSPTVDAINQEYPVQRSSPVRSTPQVLNRMIRILGVRRADQDTDVILTIRLKAQVGQKELDTSAVGVCVQAFRENIRAIGMTAIEPQWLDVIGWQNFSVRTFTSRLSIPPNEFGGFIIRTYYRNQLQDVTALPESLLKIAPDPLQNSIQ